MDWTDIIDPLTALGNTAASVVAAGWTVAMLGVWNAGLWLLRVVLEFVDAFTTPDLSASGPLAKAYGFTFWIAAALVVILLLVQLGTTAFRRDGQSLARALIGSGQFGMAWTAWAAYAVAVVAAAGGLIRALMKSMLGVDALSAWQPWSGFSTADVTDATVATVLGVMGLFLVFATIAHLFVMLARSVALMVLAATTPIAAAGLVWEGGAKWFWMTFRWFHAAAFTPVVMVMMFGLGTQAANGVALGLPDDLQNAVGTALPGVLLIVVGAFAPLALFKLLAFVDPGTSSGSAMRAGWAAQGGFDGLMNGGRSSGSGGGTSDAASTSDDNGQSQGEVASEATANNRAASAGGKLLGGLGAVGQGAAAGWGRMQGFASQAAAMGTDLTNQMGVGHNTYAPDFTGSRSSSSGNESGGGSSSGGKSDDVPDINGSGSQGGAAPDMAPPGAPTPGAGGGAGGATAGEAAGGSEAAAAAVVVL